VEILAKREERSYLLLAQFSDGFAAGWKIAVREAFKEALDIRLTERKIGNRAVMRWTQGNLFDFHVGDTFHDTQEAYSDWAKALKNMSLSVQILEASPSTQTTSQIVEAIEAEVPVQITKGSGKPKEKILDRLKITKQHVKHGIVKFRVFRPNSNCTAIEPAESYECTQEEFISFLQTGTVYTIQYEHFDLFAKNT